MTEKLNVQVELVKLFSVKENANGTKYRYCNVKFTDPVSKETEVVLAQIWESSIENGTQVGDMLNAELNHWTTTEGKPMLTVKVFGGSDAKIATLDLFKNAIAVKTPATDLNNPM